MIKIKTMGTSRLLYVHLHWDTSLLMMGTNAYTVMMMMMTIMLGIIHDGRCTYRRSATAN